VGGRLWAMAGRIGVRRAAARRALAADSVAPQAVFRQKSVVFRRFIVAPPGGSGHLTSTLLTYSFNDFNILSKISKEVRYI
jgi:hypothetical protein